MTAISTFAKEDFIIMKYVRIFFSVLFLLASLGGLLSYISTKDIVTLIGTVIFSIIAILLLVCKSKSPEEKAIKKEEKANIKRAKEIERRNSLKGYKTILEHCGGLPMAVNTDCTVIYKPDSFEFIGGGHSITLDINKVTDMNIVTNVQIINGSVGGAILGNELLGTPGAIIGGSNRKNKTKYLIITYYDNNGNIKHIKFYIDSLNSFTIQSWVNEFKKSNSQAVRHVEL